jgi:nucleoside-diphosphate-sugar epimerase
MNLLFTGVSGFLGNNLKPLLSQTYTIKTLGLTNEDDIKIDLSKAVPEIKDSFDIVLHAAGKAHTVPKTEAEKKLFFDVNYQGTVNLCDALEQSQLPKAFIFISTVAVYGLEFGENITEDHPLNGNSPYALSKIQAEQFLTSWCEKNGVILGILRPSLIAGKNPPGNLGDMIKGIASGRYLSIAGGKARKSVLMVEDIAHVLPLLCEKGGIYNVCDDVQPSFRELEILISKQLGKKPPPSIPYWMAKSMALVGDVLGEKAPINSSKLKKITKSLTFSNEKAKRELNWLPLNVLENFRIKK